MILALGGNGFIGRNFVKRFASREKIRILGQTEQKELIMDNVEFVKGDFRFIDFEPLLNGVDTVFHFISSTVPGDGTKRVMEDIETNIMPTVRLLECMKKKKIKKIFFISSGGAVYGECSEHVTEDAKLCPECAYAVQKVCIENYIHLYEKYDGIQGYILRVSNPYGLDMNKGKNQGIIPIFTQKILAGESIEVWGNGRNRRDYIYIDEVIDAIEAVYYYNGKYRIFNIGTGISYSIQEIIKLIEKETGVKAIVSYKEKRKCDLRNSFLDSSLIFKECGWRSMLTIEQGIKDYINSMKH